MTDEARLLRGIAAYAALATSIACHAEPTNTSARSIASPTESVRVRRRIGTRHPIQVRAIGHDRRWVIACQARVDTDGNGQVAVNIRGDEYLGDELLPYVFRNGTGAGQAIDAFVDASRDGRWLVVIRDGKLVVIDMMGQPDREIPDADVRAPNGRWRNWARIDDSQRKLLYVHAADPREVAIFDLEFGDVLVGRAARPVMSIDPEPGAAWAMITISPAPGTLQPMRVFQSDMARDDLCKGTHAEHHGAREIAGWLSLDTGALSPSSVISHLPGADLVRAPDHSIRVGATTIVPASCEAIVDWVSASPLRVVATCRGTADKVSEELFGDGVHAVLTGTEAYWYPSSVEGMGPRLPSSPVYCASPGGCFALDDGHRISVPGDSLHLSGNYVFSRHRGDRLVTDVRTGATTSLLPLAKMQSRQDLVESYLSLAIDVSIAPPRAIRVLDDFRQDIDDHGRVLVSAPPGDEPLGDLPLGPLTWVEPEIAPTP